MTGVIRIASVADAPGIQAVYAPAVRESAASFETEPPSVHDMRGRVERAAGRTPWLVADICGRIAGYAYAGPHRTRAAYRWTIETSVYVHPEHRRQGIGAALYAALLPLSTQLGYATALAGITLPNPASVALHEAAGFVRAGLYPAIGYKLGRWHDVGWWIMALHDRAGVPAEPTMLSDFSQERLAELLDAGTARLHRSVRQEESA